MCKISCILISHKICLTTTKMQSESQQSRLDQPPYVFVIQTSKVYGNSKHFWITSEDHIHFGCKISLLHRIQQGHLRQRHHEEYWLQLP
mmetsp:Transcript_6403/g.8806  ORF Transcript_6403/g.8806 Transcript_6403/m.8806 type:complete len:89 (-) Transcript_6403:863-1129(-)